MKKRPFAQLFDLHEHVLIEARVCIQLVTQFPVVLDRHVSTQGVYYETYSCACSHTKRRLSVHFLTYEVMPMRNFKHITPCLSHNFPQVQSHFLSYGDVSEYSLTLSFPLLKHGFICQQLHTEKGS